MGPPRTRVRVVDAHIPIGPDGTNPVGAAHVFTAKVTVDDGLFLARNAPDGTAVRYTIESGPGAARSRLCRANPVRRASART